ncbi:hypothetical protein [Spongorhabdus nitratireducens]
MSTTVLAVRNEDRVAWRYFEEREQAKQAREEIYRLATEAGMEPYQIDNPYDELPEALCNLRIQCLHTLLNQFMNMIIKWGQQYDDLKTLTELQHQGFQWDAELHAWLEKKDHGLMLAIIHLAGLVYSDAGTLNELEKTYLTLRLRYINEVLLPGCVKPFNWKKAYKQLRKASTRWDTDKTVVPKGMLNAEQLYHYLVAVEYDAHSLLKKYRHRTRYDEELCCFTLWKACEALPYVLFRHIAEPSGPQRALAARLRKDPLIKRHVQFLMRLVLYAPDRLPAGHRILFLYLFNKTLISVANQIGWDGPTVFQHLRIHDYALNAAKYGQWPQLGSHLEVTDVLPLALEVSIPAQHCSDHCSNHCSDRWIFHPDRVRQKIASQEVAVILDHLPVKAFLTPDYHDVVTLQTQFSHGSESSSSHDQSVEEGTVDEASCPEHLPQQEHVIPMEVSAEPVRVGAGDHGYCRMVQPQRVESKFFISWLLSCSGTEAQAMEFQTSKSQRMDARRTEDQASAFLTPMDFKPEGGPDGLPYPLPEGPLVFPVYPDVPRGTSLRPRPSCKALPIAPEWMEGCEWVRDLSSIKD